jgi:hypothetical protein
MTPLKPLANLQVKGTTFGPPTYPLNTVCAHPECTDPVEGKHHCFPKSQLKGDYWWVEYPHPAPDETHVSIIIPNVVGLCGSGTTGHHGEVEGHLAWIKLEDGVFNWYLRDQLNGEEWHLIGPLNPQPGSREGKPKRKRKTGEARRKRRTISIKVPNDTENGGELWDELIEEVRDCLIRDGYEKAAELPVYETVMAGLYGYVRS